MKNLNEGFVKAGGNKKDIQTPRPYSYPSPQKNQLMTTSDLKELRHQLHVHNYAETNRDVYQLVEEAIRYAEWLEEENERLREEMSGLIDPSDPYLM